MKVKIRKYPTWLGPYQLVEKLCFWAKKKEVENGYREKPDWVFDLGSRFADTWLGNLWSNLAQSWIKFHEKRQVSVRIDYWDTWNMDHTLSHIIAPMLKQLRECKHGAPFVDDEDVPEHLRSTAAKPKENDWDVDEFHFDRWDWVMDEMIWSFEHMYNDWEKDYYDREDYDSMRVVEDRMQNGFRLFGKYYRNLWD